MKFLFGVWFIIFQSFGLHSQNVKLSNTIKYVLHNETTEIEIINDNIAHIVKYKGTNMPVKNNLIVLDEERMSEKTSTKETETSLIIQSLRLKVVLNKNNGVISFFDGNGNLLLAESVTEQPFQLIDDSVTHVSQSFRLSSDEAVYGLGQHQNGKMNQRNQTILLKQRNMDIAVPFLQSTKGYGIYWNNYSATIYSDNRNVMNLMSEAGNCINYYFIAGKNADAIIDGYRNLTGKVPMFPLWSFGYIQSRERYQSQQEVVDVVRKYRALKVPLDALVQDWQYWGTDNHNWNSVQFDNPNYSNPDAMIDSVHSMNAKILISVWPSFGEKSAIYKEMKTKKMLFDFKTYPEDGGVKVYDAFDPYAREVYWKYMNKNLFSKGIDGWWLDATEPEQKQDGDASRKDTFNTSVIQNAVTYLGNYKSCNNAFPFETVNGVYQHQRNTTSDKRVFILTRSAFAGQQRAASMVWSGDITSSWQTLKNQIPAALNYSLSGMPYWNADIGGFFSGTNYPKGNKDLLYQELYIRWLQFGVFTGMMRSHGTNTPREIYQFGKPGDIAFDIIRKYIGLRYKLEPYIYSSAWAVTSRNASLMRPLVMDYPHDENVYNLGTEYLFGNSILVTPVTDSIFAKGVTALDTASTAITRTYLPQGEWYNFGTGEKLSGGRSVTQRVSLSQMPLFIKAGSIIPLAEEAQYSSVKNFKTLTINVYPGEDASFELYEDEGDNYNYEKGKYSIIRFIWNDKSKILTVGNRQGSYNGMTNEHIFKINIIGTASKAIVHYKGSAQKISF